MDWSDEGIVLGLRRHGEDAAVLSLLTRDHGRHRGLVRGAFGRRGRGLYQPGNEVLAAWRARLADHLGSFACELKRDRAEALLDDAAKLEGLAAACAVVDSVLPDREPHPEIHAATLALLDAVAALDDWPLAYVHWELMLLEALGFALDLERCALSGAGDGLAFVSPRSGRAVTLAAAGQWRERLLPLPGFLVPGRGQPAVAEDLAAGLALTGHFLERQIWHPQDKPMPAARTRLVERYARATTTSGV
ncbi:MAG: DNA repair protein RecO [Alphaproteobacteria bacterium]|nr:DNA repair protein RecO [Alphaproteobacteria bacterium]